MTSADRYDWLLCDMIAVAHSQSDEILAPGRLSERVKIFQEYACGGMDYLLSLVDDGRTPRGAVEAVIRGTDRDSSVEELRESLASWNS